MVIDVDAAEETTLTALACRPVKCANVRRHASQQQVHGQDREIGASPKGSWRFDRVGERSGVDGSPTGPVRSAARAARCCLWRLDDPRPAHADR